MNKHTVLVIDDAKDLIELVRFNLEKSGFDIMSAIDGRSGLEIATQHAPDIILLDLMMPGMDGLEICRHLRQDPRTRQIPIIMLTARAEEADRIVGLELGADDYITKPFSPRELVARVKAILRRTTAPPSPEVIRHGDLTIDVARHEVNFKGAPVSLTATQFRILHFLASQPGRVVSRERIIDAALAGDSSVYDRTIDVHITSIRKKLGSGADCIQTVRGCGYKLADHASA